MAIRHRKRNAPHREGIGLYTYEQEKNATPYGYFAQVVVGTIFAILGFAWLASQIALRGEEIRKYGSAETDVKGWIGSLAVIVIGLFLGHAGVVFGHGELSREVSLLIGRTNRTNAKIAMVTDITGVGPEGYDGSPEYECSCIQE